MAPAEQPNPEDELRQLRQLVNHLPGGIVGYWDRNLRNVIANDAYLGYFAMAPHQVHGRHIREVLGETVYALNLPYIMGALAGRPQLFERELVGLGGIRRRTLLSYIPDIVDGEVLGFYIQAPISPRRPTPSGPSTMGVGCSRSAWPMRPTAKRW